MASTHKPVFLAALVDIASRRRGGPLDAGRWISRGDGYTCVDLELVAIPFAKYYWDMAAAFDPRHTPPRMADTGSPGRDISIVELIRDEAARMKEEGACKKGGGAEAGAAWAAGAARGRGRRASSSPAGGIPPTLGELASDEMAGFRRRVVAGPIRREVLPVLRMDVPGLYEYRRGKNCIAFDEGAMEYMRCNAAALKAALGGLVARHLEACNPTARRWAAW